VRRWGVATLHAPRTRACLLNDRRQHHTQGTFSTNRSGGQPLRNACVAVMVQVCTGVLPDTIHTRNKILVNPVTHCTYAATHTLTTPGAIWPTMNVAVSFKSPMRPSTSLRSSTGCPGGVADTHATSAIPTTHIMAHVQALRQCMHRHETGARMVHGRSRSCQTPSWFEGVRPPTLLA
jgi:hypothetical protein